MKPRYHIVLSIVLTWILWQRVVNLTDQSERWINQTSYISQRACLSQAPRIIDELRNRFLQRGLGAAYIFDEGVGGFTVEDKEKHVFMCYDSVFDPRPRT